MAGLGTILLFLIVSMPLISAQCNYETAMPYFKRSVYQFTLKLVEKINQETHSHFVTSALSQWTLLSALSLGASDGTLQELREVLQLHPDRCFNNLYFKLMNQVTMKPSYPTAFMLERSSTIFFDDTLHIKQSFIDEVAKVGIDTKIVSFIDTVETAAIINKHVQSVTNEAIDEADLDDILIVMVNALYFKGAWKIFFAETESSTFYNDKGQQIGDVSLMYVSGSFNMTTVSQIKAKVLELPYGDDNRYSMLIFLPNPDVSLTTMLGLMKTISISSIFSLYKQYRATVVVQIPRFKISSDIKLQEVLIDMGLYTIFNQNVNFPGISDYELHFSNFIQKAVIEVTEDDAVAAADNVAFIESRMLPEQFIANKPFLFMIVHRVLHVPIFTGAYSKPSHF